jgi:hypothetical protein
MLTDPDYTPNESTAKAITELVKTLYDSVVRVDVEFEKDW